MRCASRAGPPEAQDQGRALGAGEPSHARDPSGLHDVARARRTPSLVKALVVLEVGPAVVAAQQPGAAPAEAWARDERGRDGLLRVRGDQRAPGRAAAVVHAGVGQRRVVDGVHPVAAAVERLEPHPDDQRVAARIGHVGLGDPVAAGGRGADLLEAQAALVGTRRHHVDVLGLAVDERATVGHHELEAAGARRRQIGVEDLADPAVLEGEPHVAATGAGRAEAGLVRLGPGALRAAVGGHALRGARTGAQWRGQRRRGQGEGDRTDEQAQRHGGLRDGFPPSYSCRETRTTPRWVRCVSPGRTSREWSRASGLPMHSPRAATRASLFRTSPRWILGLT